MGGVMGTGNTWDKVSGYVSVSTLGIQEILEKSLGSRLGERIFHLFFQQKLTTEALLCSETHQKGSVHSLPGQEQTGEKGETTQV